MIKKLNFDCRNGPAINNFNELLKRPDLNKYNALLETSPTLAIRDNKLVYLKTLDVEENITTYNWTAFSSLPDNVKVDANTSCAIFSFQGDLYLSVNKNTWVKKVRSISDPAFKNGIPLFPDLYSDTWEQSGNLPDDTYKSVVSFSTTQKIIVLNNNFKLNYLKSDKISTDSEWVELKSANDNKTPTPTLISIAYSNDLVGLDNRNQLHTIIINTENLTYKTLQIGEANDSTVISSNENRLVSVTRDQLQV